MTKIILISGTAGTGKTTISRELVNKLKISHRIGTGFVREILRTTLTKKKYPKLYNYTFRNKNPINNLLDQAKILKPAIINCIKRAENEGTSLLIEGNHLIPKLYKDVDVDLFIVIKADKKLERQINGKTHSKRKISQSDLNNIKKIDEFLIKDAERYKIPIIVNKTVTSSVNRIKELLK